MFKRCTDVVVSVALLLFASPILLLSALIIRLTSPGPALFRQSRMGRSFRTFEILKLRTMAHAEGGLAYTLGPDPRITPIGNFLRRSKIDEFPQFWNVLRGDMSLVGPRPVLPELVEEFRDQYSSLLKVRPGLTDPASLKYSQEAELLSKDADPMDFFKSVVTPDKIRISQEYIYRATASSDAAIMAMTFLICFVPAFSRLFGELPITRKLARINPYPNAPLNLQEKQPLPGNPPPPVHERLVPVSYLVAQRVLAGWNLSPNSEIGKKSTLNESA